MPDYKTIKGGYSTFSGSQTPRRAEEKYSYSYADGPCQVSDLQAPDIGTGRKDAMGMDKLAKDKMKAKLSKQLEGGSMSKGSDKAKLGKGMY